MFVLWSNIPVNNFFQSCRDKVATSWLFVSNLERKSITSGIQTIGLLILNLKHKPLSYRSPKNSVAEEPTKG